MTAAGDPGGALNWEVCAVSAHIAVHTKVGSDVLGPRVLPNDDAQSMFSSRRICSMSHSSRVGRRRAR